MNEQSKQSKSRPALSWVLAFLCLESYPMFAFDEVLVIDNPTGMRTRFGSAVLGAFDVNGDGHNDIAVGTHFSDEGGIDAGKVEVFSGFDGTLIWARFGDADYRWFGKAIARAGDYNGDGIDDLLVGEPRYPDSVRSRGRVSVLSGSTGELLKHFETHELAMREQFGSALAYLGDVNHDGIADYLVGAPGHRTELLYIRGKIVVVSGADGSELYHRVGDSKNQRLGISVLALGDVDADGIPDFAVTSQGYSEAGSVLVYSGESGKILYILKGEKSDERFGHAIANIGDINNDQADDFVVGAPDENFRYGKVQVFSGADGESLLMIKNDYNDSLGAGVSGLGDVNGDGINDFAASAPGHDIPLKDVGMILIYSGADASILQVMTGKNPRDMIGQNLTYGGTQGRDGKPHLIVGSPHANEYRGSVSLYRIDLIPGGNTHGEKH